MTKDILQVLLFGQASEFLPKDVLKYGGDAVSAVTGNPLPAIWGNEAAGFRSGQNVGDSFKMAALEGGETAIGSVVGGGLGSAINSATGAAAGSLGSELGSAAGQAATAYGLHEATPALVSALGLNHAPAPGAPSSSGAPSSGTPFGAAGGAVAAGPPGGAEISSSTAPGIYPWTKQEGNV